MALGHGAALLVLGQRQHVPFKIQRDAVAAHQLVHRGDHLAVALVAMRAIGLEERIHLGGPVVRHAVQRHVGHGMLIGIVDALARERRARHVHAALNADRRAHMHDVSRFEELLRAGNGIVIHQAAGTQPRLIGEPDRRRRRIGREGIDRVDVVVHVGALHGLRLLSGQLTQVLQSFGRVEQLERLFAGDRHGEYASILTNIKILYICRLIVRLTRVKISFATAGCSHLLQGVLRLESAVLPPLHPSRRISENPIQRASQSERSANRQVTPLYAMIRMGKAPVSTRRSLSFLSSRQARADLRSAFALRIGKAPSSRRII